MISGIVIGNVAIWKMMDGYEEATSDRSQMFSSVGVTSSGNKRVEAGKWYRQTHPGGSLIQGLRLGQGLTIAGFLITFLLLAI